MNKEPARQLKIGVVIPTLNSMALLPRHIAFLQKWIHVAEEVVVVDSLSTDGTFEFLRKELRHPAITFHERPPGLYESWNFGIAQLSTEWAYISTVGEQITEAGIRRLMDAATSHEADIVISPPRFINERGSRVRRKRWPVHHIVGSRKWRPRESLPLHPLSVFMLSALEAPMGMLGSSAANLYKTACLRKYPFSSRFGHFGDTAWAIAHAFQAKFALVPNELSTFVLHRSGAAMDSEKLEHIRGLLFESALETLRQRTTSMKNAELDVVVSSFEQFIREFQSMRQLEAAYDRQRRAHRPWVLNAGAWKARRQRERQRTVVYRLKRSILEACERAATQTREACR